MKNIIGYIEQNGSFTDIKTNAPKTSKGIIIPSAVSETEGYFGTDSMHWKLYREPGILVAGISALLLQIAHPAVAEGVRQFSVYHSDFLGRAHRTIVSMTRIWFGHQAEATQSAQRLFYLHGQVKGVYHKKENGVIKTIPFSANDPDLLCWVLATMNWATVAAYEKMYRSLTSQEKEQFFEETKKTAQLMGIPLDQYPKNWWAFTDYYSEMIRGNQLEVSTDARRLSDTISKAYFPLTGFMQVLAAGFLPQKLHAPFGLKHKPRLLNCILKIIAFVLKIIPSELRFAPHYHIAQYRLAKARNTKPSLLARWHCWMANKVPLPIFSNKLNWKKS